MSVHNNFKVSIAALKRDLVRSIHYLRMIYDHKVYKMLGYKNITCYAAAVGGISEGQCKAFLKIGLKLEELPEMQRAIADGSLSWTRASHIVAQATPENESELIDVAQQISSRQLRFAQQPSRVEQVSGAVPQPAPPAPVSNSIKPPPETPVAPADTPCYVSFRFTPEQYSNWASLCETLGSEDSKEEFLLQGLAALLRKSKSGAEGPGYVIHLQNCPSCDLATLSNTRGTFDVPKSMLEAAHCDATLEDAEARRRQVVPPRIRRAILQRDQYRCQAQGCAHTQFLEIHHILPTAKGGRCSTKNLVTLCSRCHRQLHKQEIELLAANRDPV